MNKPKINSTPIQNDELETIENQEFLETHLNEKVAEFLIF